MLLSLAWSTGRRLQTAVNERHDARLDLGVVRGRVQFLALGVGVEVGPRDAVEAQMVEAQMVEAAGFAALFPPSSRWSMNLNSGISSFIRPGRWSVVRDWVIPVDARPGKMTWTNTPSGSSSLASRIDIASITLLGWV